MLSPDNGGNNEDIPLIPKQSAKKEISIPQSENTSFSFKKLWSFTGPGLLMSIGFLDPGNITSDLETGAVVKYQLLWVLLSATIVGLVMQRLSVRLGVVTKLHLAELCFIHYKKWPRLVLWIMTEIAVVCSDIQYKMGTAIAIYSLSNTVIPLWAGVLLTTVDVLIFSYFDKFGLRRLEFFLAILIGIMAVTFGYEFVASRPVFVEMVEAMFIPRCNRCDSTALLQAVSIIGSNVMPYNLFLHSALVKSHEIDTSNPFEVREANFYFLVESVLAVTVGFLINFFIVTVFGNELYRVFNHRLVTYLVGVFCLLFLLLQWRECGSYLNGTDAFPDTYQVVKPDLFSAGLILGCIFGVTAMYIWYIGILASAQSATITVTYAGQYIIEGFLNLEWKTWQRALFCRAFSIVPTILLVVCFGTSKLTTISTVLNAAISIQLPFAIFPTIAFTSSASIMGDFVNSRISTICFTVLSIAIIGINTYFVVHGVLNLNWYFQIPIALLGLFYFTFYLYLIVHLLILSGIIKRAMFDNCNYIFVAAELSTS